MTELFAPLCPPTRVLMGPGPSDVAPSVLRALSAPTIGHLDPAFAQAMDEIRTMLRLVFGSQNPFTMPMSGTGTAGMETLMANLLSPGNAALVCINGVFGERLAQMAERAGATVTRLHFDWGKAVDPNRVRDAVAGKHFDVLCLVHAETSTGVLTDLSPFRSIADECSALFITDCVTSLAGLPVDIDANGVDAAYSGTQKCLSCPPGLSPITVSERAMERIAKRTATVNSWYLDLKLIGGYWNPEQGASRSYHHTAPINMLYGLHEALRLVLHEGLPARYARHRENSKALRDGLIAMGLSLPVAEADRLDPLTLVSLPDGIDDAQFRKTLLSRYGLEIGGGLGDFKGKAWRIGLMGFASKMSNVTLCLSAIEELLKEFRH